MIGVKSRQLKFVISSLLLILTIFVSCRTSENLNVIDYSIRHHSIEKNLIHSYSGDTSILTVSYDYYEKPNASFKDSVNKYICHFLNLVTSFETVKDNCSLDSRFVISLLDTFTSRYYEDEDENYSLWDLETITSIHEFSDFVELHNSYWSYTGGAHGNSSLDITLFDQTDGRVLTLEDFFTDVSRLNLIIEPIFRKAMGLDKSEDLSEAGFWFVDGKFSVNSNFYFTSEQVCFYYNTYEIAPYVMGAIEIKVPISEVSELLRRPIK